MYRFDICKNRFEEFEWNLCWERFREVNEGHIDIA